LFFFLACPALAEYGHFDEFDTIKQEQQVHHVIPKGSFFRVFLGQTVSSEFNNNGDYIKLLVPSDYLMNNTIVIPQNAVFIGVVKNLGKAQRGMDGYFSIDVVGLVFPDGRQFNTQGYVSFGKSRVLGGAFTRRVGHRDVLHRAQANGSRGILQLKQNGPRVMGKETRLKMGTFVEMVLESNIDID